MSCFSKIRSSIVKNVSSWDNNRKQITFEALDCGKAILKNQDELDRYIFAFGKMHQAKLNFAFETIQDLENINKQEISIIDYGCGQGIGTIVLMDYLNSLSLDFFMNNVKLIEPSEIALRVAKKIHKLLCKH